MLFHKGGPLVGQSRGYAFVTFATPAGSMNALEKLNGVLVANRPIAVRMAKNVNYDDLDRPKPRIEIPALGAGKCDSGISKDEAIRAIEAKLRMLERRSDEDLEINTIGSSSSGHSDVPLIHRYQFNKDRDAGGLSNQRNGYGNRTKFGSGPYNRNQRPKRR